MIGGWRDIFYDQECESLKNIVTYNINDKLWSEHNINIELFEVGACLIVIQQNLLLFGGFRNGDGTGGDEYLNDIYKIDISNNEYIIEKLNIKCPEYGKCSVIMICLKENNELLLSGFTRKLQTEEYALFNHTPQYLISLMASHLINEKIFYVNHKSRKCYSILWTY